LRVRECKESIILFERFSARNAVKDAKESGICTKRLEDRSRLCRVLTNGASPVDDMLVIELSAKLRCFRKRHFVDGRTPSANKFELLPRGLYQVSEVLECELLDPDRFTL
jgi:hypothetical protein